MERWWKEDDREGEGGQGGGVEESVSSDRKCDGSILVCVAFVHLATYSVLMPPSEVGGGETSALNACS